MIKKLSRNRDLGRLIIRIGIGLSFITHGYPKLIGGIATWDSLGQSMGYLEITFLPVFWGFMAAVSEFFGGIMFLIGFNLRIACIFLGFTMFVATIYHFGKGDGLHGASHTIELMTIFVGMFFIGPGKYSLDGR